MRVTIDRLRILGENGLTEYQARVYLALLDSPSLPAGALAKTVQVPRNRLYEVLEELQALGLVEIILGETRQYRAYPFTAYLERNATELRDRAEKIDSQKAFLGAAFTPPELTETEDIETGSTQAVLSRRAVAREIDSLIDDAKESIVAVGSDGGWQRVVHHLAGLDSGSSRNVEVFLPPRAALEGGFERLPETVASSIRWMPVAPRSLCFIADERVMLLIHAVPDDSKPRAGHDFALLTTNTAFVADHLWMLRAAPSAAMVAAAAGAPRAA